MTKEEMIWEMKRREALIFESHQYKAPAEYLRAMMMFEVAAERVEQQNPKLLFGKENT